MDFVAWSGVIALGIQTIQGIVQIARHFKLYSKCCGYRSEVGWDVSEDTPKDPYNPL